MAAASRPERNTGPIFAPPDFVDALQLLLVVSALVVDAVALAAIAASNS